MSGLFPGAADASGIERLRAAVFSSPETQSRLAAFKTDEEFVRAVVSFTEGEGIAITREEIEAEMTANFKRWLERFL